MIGARENQAVNVWFACYRTTIRTTMRELYALNKIRGTHLGSKHRKLTASGNADSRFIHASHHAPQHVLHLVSRDGEHNAAECTGQCFTKRCCCAFASIVVARATIRSSSE
jgi:hypothetical protein